MTNRYVPKSDNIISYENLERTLSQNSDCSVKMNKCIITLNLFRGAYIFLYDK